ncbi:ABC transporter ATP-binding protein [Pontiellaceae bacterium B12227]|nr:ABC transporter ATP-binding protein [Pontiellaceae bacterium B12227]
MTKINSTSPDNVLCTVSQVYKSYGSQSVLNGVDFEIHEGEQVALMGPSGSGKSTLLNCLSGIDRPDQGSIEIGGLEITSASAAELAEMRRGTVSTVFQFFHLLPTLSAFENIELSLQLIGVSPRDRRSRVEELLEAVQLSSHADAFPETLSGGERQRVAIARALAHRPRLLLADEPTGSLDTQTGDSILQLLSQLAGQFNIAMVLVTHSVDAARICQRTIHMRDGKIG